MRAWEHFQRDKTGHQGHEMVRRQSVDRQTLLIGGKKLVSAKKHQDVAIGLEYGVYHSKEIAQEQTRWRQE